MEIRIPSNKEIADFVESGAAMAGSLSKRNIVTPYSDNFMIKIYENGNEGKRRAQRESTYSTLFHSYGVNVPSIYGTMRLRKLQINEHTENVIEKIGHKPFVVIMERVRGRLFNSLQKEAVHRLMNAFNIFLEKLAKIPAKNTDFYWSLEEIILHPNKGFYLTDFEDCTRGPINGLSEDIRSLRLAYADLMKENE